MKYVLALAILFSPLSALACYIPIEIPKCDENQTLVDNQCVDNPVETPDTPQTTHKAHHATKCHKPGDIVGFRYEVVGGNTRLRWNEKENAQKVDITVYQLNKVTIVSKFRTNDTGEYTYPGTNHFFRIRGVNACGLGDWSRIIN